MSTCLVEALRTAAGSLEASSDTPQIDAELLLQAATGLTAAQLIARADEPLGEAAHSAFQNLLAQRKNGEPIAYLLGKREFYGLGFRVTPDVLIPRPETELLVDMALQKLPAGQAARVLDLGTGSGAIAVAIAVNRPKAKITAVEQSDAALRVAEENARQHQCENIECLQGSWFAPLHAGQSFDLIVCNPPYIDPADPHLGEGDVRFEPRAALVAENQGLAAYQHIIPAAQPHLVDGGWLLFEHGFSQADSVHALLAKAGMKKIETCRDLAGHERVTLAMKPASPL